MDKQQVISAQVVLQSASGRVPSEETAITSGTIKEFAPSMDAIHRARQVFAAAGFDAGPLVGNSFSITAPVSTFESVFHTQVRSDAHGGIQATRGDGSGAYELPRESLPTEISRHIIAVTFTPPPAFGPGGSGP